MKLEHYEMETNAPVAASCYCLSTPGFAGGGFAVKPPPNG